jgi:hypothetical protein
MGTFDLVASTYAASAEDAPVVVYPESFVAEIHLTIRVQVIEVYMVHTGGDGQILKFTVAVGDADRTDVVAFSEDKLKDRTPVVAEPLRIGPDHHVLNDSRHASRLETTLVADFHEADSASADITQSIEMTERRDRDPCVARGLKDGLVLASADQFAVNRQSPYDGHNHHLTGASRSWD